MATSSAIKRHGGKAYLAENIRNLFQPHTRYCEPFFGSGAVMFGGDGVGVAEFANDADMILQTFWYVLADADLFADFHRRLQATPFSEPRFDEAKARIKSVEHCIRRPQVEIALDFFVLNRQSRQAIGRDFATPTSRLRRGMNEQVSAWLSAVDGLPEFHERLRRVEIRCADALDFIRELDTPDTLFYCDPPYMAETRFNGGGEYGKHEMHENDHRGLLNRLAVIKGKFCLSGYPNAIYDDAAARHGWRHVDFVIDNKASGAKSKEKKIERVWMNY